jgi:hypothetical protein
MTEHSESDQIRSGVSGEVIPYKKESPLFLAACGVALLALGAACWVIHLALSRWIEWELFPLLGTVLLVCGLLALFFAFRSAFRPVTRSLVLGDDRLQIVENDEKVVEQYHYQDVRGFKAVDKIIGIDLKKPLSDQTIPPAEEVRSFQRENFGYEAILEARIQFPTQELIDRLNNRLREYRQANPDSQPR